MKSILILLEGEYDTPFFEQVVRPMLKPRFRVKLFEYAQEPNALVCRLILGYKDEGHKYLFITDIDTHTYGCNTERKAECCRCYPSVEPEFVRVVWEEIEGWYVAGVTEEDWSRLTGQARPDPNALTKEQFDSYIPAGTKKLDFILELLDCYSVDQALNSSSSFAYFHSKDLV